MGKVSCLLLTLSYSVLFNFWQTQPLDIIDYAVVDTFFVQPLQDLDRPPSEPGFPSTKLPFRGTGSSRSYVAEVDLAVTLPLDTSTGARKLVRPS